MPLFTAFPLSRLIAWIWKSRVQEFTWCLIPSSYNLFGFPVSLFGCQSKHLMESVDKSLERLQTDYIDLYYLHYDDEKTPVAETLEAFAEMVKSGKVKHIAASNISSARLKESLE